MLSETDRDKTIRTLEEQNAQLLALFLASQRLSSTLQLEEVERTVLDILVEFTGAAEASIWVQDNISGRLQLIAGRGLEELRGRTIAEGSGVIGAVATTGEEILDGERRLDPATKLPVLAAVPLRMGENSIGAVAIHRLAPQKSAFEETDRELMRLIAAQAAASLTSARLYEESRQILKRFKELGERVVANLDDLDAVARTTVQTVAELARADVCQLYLVDEETGDLALAASAGVSDPPIGSTLKAGQGIAGRVLTSNMPLRLTRGVQLPSALRLAPLEEGGPGGQLGSVLAVPLRAGRNVIGVLSVGRMVGVSDWDGDEETTLTTAADQLAVAINNARLYARVEDDYYKMSTLFMAANRLHATLDLDEILHSARDILESLVGAQTYAVLLVDELTKELRIVLAEGISPLHRSTFRASLREGFLAQVLQNGDPYLAPVGQPARERLFGQPVLACVPLRVEGVVVGAFVLNRLAPQKRSLVAYDAELFSMLAQHAATAILAARLYARAEQRLVSLYDLSRLISASVSSEEILDLTMGLVTQVMRSRVAVLYTIDADSGNLRLSRSAGLTGRTQSRQWLSAESAVRQAMDSGEMVDTEDAATDPRFRESDGFFRGPTLLVPLKVGKNVIGILAVTDKLGEEGFGREDRRLASTLAGQIGLIIHQAELYEQAQHLAILLEREREALRSVNQDLEVANRQLDALVEHISEGVLLVDSSGSAIRLNAAGRSLLGFGPGDALPEEFTDWDILQIRAEDGKTLPISDWPLSRAIRGESVRGGEILTTTRAGEVRSLQVGAEPVRGPDNQVVMAVLVFRDVTEERALDRAKDEFLAVASHELKSPMTALKGYAQLLLRQSARSEQPGRDVHTLQVINDQSDRLVRLVDQLLDLSRIELGRLQLELETTDLVSLAEAAAADQRVADPNHPIRIVAEVQQIEGRWDRARIAQVVTNLLSNASKFSPPGAEIEIRMWKQGDSALLAVHDQGPGIPGDQLDRIFERYAQAGSKKGTHKGLGLGLYISRRIVDAHRGRIWAESEQGQGSTFHVTLPLTDATGQTDSRGNTE